MSTTVANPAGRERGAIGRLCNIGTVVSIVESTFDAGSVGEAVPRRF
jgi:hypothetical protein